MNMLKTYILLPSGHGVHIYRRKGGLRGTTKFLATREWEDYVGIAEVICADMPSLHCDIGLMVCYLKPAVQFAQAADLMTYISNRDVLLWHKEQTSCATS